MHFPEKWKYLIFYYYLSIAATYIINLLKEVISKVISTKIKYFYILKAQNVLFRQNTFGFSFLKQAAKRNYLKNNFCNYLGYGIKKRFIFFKSLASWVIKCLTMPFHLKNFPIELKNGEYDGLKRSPYTAFKNIHIISVIWLNGTLFISIEVRLSFSYNFL